MMGTPANQNAPRRGVRRWAAPSGFRFVETELIRVGIREAPADASYWGSSQITGDTPIIAFAHAPIRVRFERDDPEVLTGATIGTPGAAHEYVTEPLAPRGEATTFFRFMDDTVLRLCAEHDPSAADRPERPVPWTVSPADERAAAAARRLSAHLFRRPAEPIDRVWLEEILLSIAHASIASSFRRRGVRARPDDDPVGAEAVRAVSAHIARNYGDSLGIVELAAIAGYSPGYFCRKFRRHTRMSIHQYLTSVRLMAVVERLPEREGQLARLAQETGFASHAHLTSAFRSAIGATPSQVRDGDLTWWRGALADRAGGAITRAGLERL